MIRISIYDDSKERLDSLQLLISTQRNFKCLGAYDNCNELEEHLQQTKPDVVLMDIKMPGMNGIEATRLARRLHPDLKIIIQTVYNDDDNIFNSLKAGAQGYILKSVPIEKIIQSIEDVYHGGAVMTPSIAFRVTHFFKEQQEKKAPVSSNYRLTGREQEVLKLLTEGLSYKMIAAELGISYFTVNSHIQKIYEKLQINSVGEAISIALKNNII